MRAQSPCALQTFAPDSVAIVFGASGGVGSALVDALEATRHFERVLGYGRRTAVAFDLLDAASIEAAIRHAASVGEIRLALDATGFLHDDALRPEKSLRDLDPQAMARAFAINATGPALLMKNLLPRLPRAGKSVFATLSARVGSISDNRLGGWYAYRASKAALNQIVRTAAIELARRSPDAVCVALHPGTVDTRLSAPFARGRDNVLAPAESAAHLLSVVDRLESRDTGGFFDWRGAAIGW